MVGGVSVGGVGHDDGDGGVGNDEDGDDVEGGGNDEGEGGCGVDGCLCER